LVPGQRPTGLDATKRNPSPILMPTAASAPDLVANAEGNWDRNLESPVRQIRGGDLTTLLEREWLVTNGLGGYASGTVSGAATRRYHGLLVSAQPAPLGRVMMVNHLWEFVRLPDYRNVPFGGVEKRGGNLLIHGTEHLTSFH